jgi:PAS domain S-box-containing protein
MPRKKTGSGEPTDLRSRAEKLLRKYPADLGAVPPEEIEGLFHELQVHQVELEVQNEELRKTQLELEASRGKYFDLYDMAPVGYFTLGGKGLILEANLKASELLGVERSRLARRPLTRHIVPEFQDIYYLQRKRLLETGEQQVVELRMRRQDGSLFWGRLETAVAREGKDGPPVCRVMLSDISGKKRAEEESERLQARLRQAQNMETLGALAGGIAHDFNNILMAVLGHAELASREVSPASPVSKNLDAIKAATQRAAGLCHQMLVYAGKASFAPARVRLGELVEGMAQMLKNAVSNKAVLSLNMESGLPRIEADPNQIRQVVMNLVMNALEALGDRGGAINVSVGSMQCDEEYLRGTELHDDLEPGRYVYLEVTDTGGGMDAGTKGRIFEPFFSTKFTGRGLGLSTVIGIVRAHGGALKVCSEPGKGATFRILFPAQTEAMDAVRSPEPSPPADWRGTGTILLVEDEENLLALVAQMLEMLGFTVLMASDGLQAVDLYRERGKEIDLVMTDLTMPRMDGAKLTEELRRLNPDVRVVLASGWSHEDVSSRFAGKDIDGVLQKPYTFADLRGLLSRLMPERPDGEG